MKKRIYMQKLWLAIALMAIVVSTFSSGFSHRMNAPVEKTVKAENAKQDQAELKVCVYEAIVPFAQLTISQAFYFIFEFSFENPVTPALTQEFPLYSAQFFKTLFTQIISPNAP